MSTESRRTAPIVAKGSKTPLAEASPLPTS